MAVNNHNFKHQTLGVAQRRMFDIHAEANNRAQELDSVEYYHKMSINNAPSPEPTQKSLAGKEPFTVADRVKMEQKTLTSVKKPQKVAMGAEYSSQLSRAAGAAKSRQGPLPSQAFLEKVMSNVNNTLKPPNWTVRKQSLMHRLNSQTSPCCASNIDYHLDQLANMYKESGKKVREGAEPSLMEQLLEANPSNASFLTPSSSS